MLTGRIVLSNKKRNLRKYSVVFLKHFPKKKIFGGLCINLHCIFGVVGKDIMYLLTLNNKIKSADFLNVICFVFEQSIVFHNAVIQNVFDLYYFKTSPMCIFNAVKKQSGIGYIVLLR